MRRRLGGLALLALLAVAACGRDGDGGDRSLLGDGSGPTASATAGRAATGRITSARELLDALATAVREDRRTEYAALLGGDPAFRAEQLRLYDNLQRLPVGGLSFAPADGVVQRSLRLQGYDDGTLVGPAGIRVGQEKGRYVVLPDEGHPAREPWDLTEIRSLRSAHALIVTDTAYAGRAAEIRSATEAALAADADDVPVSWSGTAVVYAFRDPAVLATYAKVPGGVLEHLGALTYPVRDSGGLVGMRVALLAPALSSSRADLDRVLRHEVVHVALGDSTTGVPTWLTEGVAEYVSMLPIRAGERRIATVAVARARAGAVDLPDAASFRGADRALQYAVAWMACDYLAAKQGPAVLWRLVAAMQSARVGRDGGAGVGQDAVLRQVTGLDSARLADAAARRILAQFG